MSLLSPKNALGIFFYVNLFSWLMLLVIKVISFLEFGDDTDFTFDFYLKGLLLNLFFLVIFFYFNARVNYNKTVKFVELLTRLFIVGLVMNSLSLIIQFVLSFLEVPPVDAQKALIIDVLYHINIALVTIYLTQTLFYWKKLVLYHKNKFLVQTWSIFEYLLLISLLFNFFEFDIQHPPFVVALGVLLSFGLALSINLKWVAYLNSREKWQSILLLLFIIIFFFYFFQVVIKHSYNPYFTTDLMHSVYILAVFIFVIFYGIFSFLVLIFNLPTTSVFEQKIEDVLSFQRLTQSLQAGESEDSVYGILLNSALSTADADAGWLEINNEKGKEIAFLNTGIDKDTINQIKQIINKSKVSKILDDTFTRKGSKRKKFLEDLSLYQFESFFSVNLSNSKSTLGSLFLLKKVRDGFDEEMKGIIKTFARQATLSIENFRLLSKTIEAERYKEEIKIAQKIQKSLLPKNLNLSKDLDIATFAEFAYEVGGDYYDAYKFEDSKIIFILGDVSGKGTNAAFHMAQMKGIFQGLAQLHFDAEHFLEYANSALINCLEKNTFITVIIMSIDTKLHQVELARAGHNPLLYYNASESETTFIKGKGLGLGIIRDREKYHAHIETRVIKYNSDDIMLLYTDGIVEAQNEKGEEYGYERLRVALELNVSKSAEDIIEVLMNDLHNFCGASPITDDHTIALIKFV